MDEPNDWLFPGRGRNHKSPAGLSNQITKHLREATGLEVNAHLFRHLTAKLFLEASPGNYEVVRRHLAHQSMDTTTNYYTGFETAGAVRLVDQQILKLRKNDQPEAFTLPVTL